MVPYLYYLYFRHIIYFLYIYISYIYIFPKVFKEKRHPFFFLFFCGPPKKRSPKKRIEKNRVAAIRRCWVPVAKPIGSKIWSFSVTNRPTDWTFGCVSSPPKKCHPKNMGKGSQMVSLVGEMCFEKKILRIKHLG